MAWDYLRDNPVVYGIIEPVNWHRTIPNVY